MTLVKILMMSVLPLCGLAQTATSSAGGYLEIKDPVIDLGVISGDSIVIVGFMMYNTGTEPVAIIKISSSCDCAVPYYKNEIIAPGDSAQFEVSYNPIGYGWGEFQRDFLIHTTASNSYISAEITGIISATN